jgi:hypothetical protein
VDSLESLRALAQEQYATFGGTGLYVAFFQGNKFDLEAWKQFISPFEGLCLTACGGFNCSSGHVCAWLVSAKEQEAVEPCTELAQRVGAWCVASSRVVSRGQPHPLDAWAAFIFMRARRETPCFLDPFCATVQALSEDLPEVTASRDFRSLKWCGTVYSFTSNQAPAVKMLVEAWRDGVPDVGDETLLQAIDPQAPPRKLADVFRGSPAWNTIIKAGVTKGTHRLTDPNKDSATAQIRP